MNGSKLLGGCVVAFVLLCSMITPVSAGTDADKSYGRVEQYIVDRNPNIKVDFEYGIDGYAVYEKVSVIRLAISCEEYFDGTVSVCPVDTDMYPTQSLKLSRKVSVPAGEKTELEFCVDTLGSGKVKVELADKSGEVVYSENDMLSIANDDMTIMTAVLSDSTDKLRYINELQLDCYADTVDVDRINVTETDLPASEIGLDALEYILIDDYDTAKLSDDQYSAMMSWMYDGGTLILSLGKNGDKVLHRFANGVVGCSAIGTELRDVSFEDGSGKVIAEQQSLNVTQFEMNGGSEVADISDSAPIYIKNIGKGRTVVVPYSLGESLAAGVQGQKAVAGRIFEEGLTGAVCDNVLRNYYDAGSSLGFDTAVGVNEKEKPSAVLIVVILCVYTLLSGPVVYIVLKRRKRQELIWVCVPALAILGTLAIYIVSLRYRVSEPVNLSFVAADISGDVKRENIYSYIIGAKSGDSKLHIDNEFLDVHVDGVNSELNSTSSENYKLEKMMSGDGTDINYHCTKPFESVDISASGESENDIGKIDSDIVLYADGFEGTVTNNTDYDICNLVVVGGVYYYCVDKLDSGESVSIDKAENMRLQRGYYYDAMKSYYEFRYGKNYIDNKDIASLMARNSYIEYLLGMYNVDKSNEGKIAVWGSIDRDTKIAGDGMENYGTYAVYSFGAGRYIDADGVYYNNIYDMADYRYSQSDYDSDDLMMYSDEVDITVRFNIGDDIKELNCIENRSGRSRVVVKALNNETGDYDVVFSNGDTVLNGMELDKYLTDGVINFRFIAPQQGDYYYDSYLPEITARGGVPDNGGNRRTD